MVKRILEILKTTIISLIVVFLFVLVISVICIKTGKKKFETATSLLEIITVDETEIQTITPVLEGRCFS